MKTLARDPQSLGPPGQPDLSSGGLSLPLSGVSRILLDHSDGPCTRRPPHKLTKRSMPRPAEVSLPRTFQLSYRWRCQGSLALGAAPVCPPPTQTHPSFLLSEPESTGSPGPGTLSPPSGGLPTHCRPFSFSQAGQGHLWVRSAMPPDCRMDQQAQELMGAEQPQAQTVASL